MGENSGIQWTDNTFNPWMGCVRVSPGCEHCYAEKLVTTRLRLPVWGPAKTTERKRTAESNWKKPLTWNRAAEKAGSRARVFCASLADVFEDHPALGPWRADLFALIERTPHLDWQLLTKRPQNLRKMLPPSWLETPRPNVWLGCTVEDQQRANERIPELLRVPAAVRFLSCEPLVEAVSLDPAICDDCGLVLGEPGSEIADDGVAWCCECEAEMSHGHWLGDADGLGISWVIVGGESGAGARPFDLAWARDIVRECRYRGVPVFVKQFGVNAVDSAGYDVLSAAGGIAYSRDVGADDAYALRVEAERMGRTIRPRNVSRFLRDSHGGDPAEWPEALRVREMPAVGA